MVGPGKHSKGVGARMITAKNTILVLIGAVMALVLIVVVPFLVSASFETVASARAQKQIEAAKIVTGWRAENWSTSSDRRFVEADIYGKRQIFAEFNQSWRVTGLARVNGKNREIQVTFLNDATPKSTRNTGEQFFGRWRFSAAEGHAFETGEITAVIAHDIDGAARVSQSGPFHYVSPY